MRLVDLVHRWTGGLIGLLLAMLGLTGTILVHKETWLRWSLPGAADVQLQDTATLAAAAERLLAGPDRPNSILFATERFGLHRLSYGGDAGGYADQAGQIVTRWSSIWERPEVWLFDIHHHLLMGETGDMIAGILGLIGLGFVVTGAILWWRTRKTFEFRLLPKRLSRPSIVRHHRDLGIVAAPLLVLSMLTGTMMTLRPVADFVLAPFSSAVEMKQAATPPAVQSEAMGEIDWTALISEVRSRYPDAEIRTIGLPAKTGGPITIRTRQQAEWLPNGRTTFWFDPADGRLIEHRDAFALPRGSQIFNLAYPLHAAKVGGLAYRLVMTLSGLSLVLLGSLTVWTFWANRRAPKARSARKPRPA